MVGHSIHINFFPKIPYVLNGNHNLCLIHLKKKYQKDLMYKVNILAFYAVRQ